MMPRAGRSLIAKLKGRPVRAIGIEPSGGYERGVGKALHKAGLPVRNVNPYKLRNLARAHGKKAKNDRIDAKMIAQFCADMPTPPMRTDPITEQLAELVIARRQLSNDKVSLTNQLGQVRDPTVKRMFAQRLRRIEADILLSGKRLYRTDRQQRPTG
jgi:transposase